MNQATQKAQDSVHGGVLYMAMELSNTTWRLAFGDGSKKRQVPIKARDLVSLDQAMRKAKERFGLAPDARVISCYEAGRVGFLLHRYFLSIGVEIRIVDS